MNDRKDWRGADWCGARFSRALLTPEQSGRADALSAAAGVSGEALMEAAGRGCAGAILRRWPDLHGAAVLCGPGNNGGDGYVVARLLAGSGLNLRVFALTDPAGLTGDAAAVAAKWRAAGGGIELLDDAAAEFVAKGCDLVVDALFGAGLSRPFEGAAALLARRLALLRVPVASIDVPSGLCGNSGRVWGDAFTADLTIAFERLKRGHVLAEGMVRCGEVAVVPIGMREDMLAHVWDGAFENAPACWPRGLGKRVDAHKYTHGHVVVVSGGPAATGAARLAARAALRVGAGLATVASPTAALAENAAQLTAVMVRAVDGDGALVEFLDDVRLNAVAIGPGAGLGAATAATVVAALETLAFERGERLAALDADALTAFTGNERALFERARRGKTVLTPHTGEFGVLFPDLLPGLLHAPGAESARSKVEVVAEAAKRAGAVVVLKGPDTVIAAPSGEIAVNAAMRERAAPWLATAGAGDVLTGMIAGLGARGFSPFDAACAAVWLHVEAGRQCGPGLISEDLPEALPAVLRRL